MQKRRVAFLTEFVRQYGYNPSIREIGQAVGLKSPSTVYNHIRRLEEEGRIAVCQIARVGDGQNADEAGY